MNCYFCNKEMTEILNKHITYHRCNNHSPSVKHWNDLVLVDWVTDKFMRAIWNLKANCFQIINVDYHEIPLYQIQYLPDYQPEDIMKLYNRLMNMKAFL